MSNENRPTDPRFPLTGTVATEGIPANKYGNDGWIACDVNTGALYVKSNGSWAALSAAASGGNSIDSSGPPSLTPPDISAIVVDSDGRQWQYYAGAWH